MSEANEGLMPQKPRHWWWDKSSRSPQDLRADLQTMAKLLWFMIPFVYFGCAIVCFVATATAIQGSQYPVGFAVGAASFFAIGFQSFATLASVVLSIATDIEAIKLALEAKSSSENPGKIG